MTGAASRCGRSASKRWPAGLLALVGVGRDDSLSDVEELAKRIVHLRIFPDDAGRMNRSLLDTGGGIRHALPLLGEEPFVILNGDIWTDYPFDRLPSEISGLAHLVLVDTPEHNPAGDFILHGDRVGESDAGVTANSLTFSGIGIYRQALFKGLDPGRIKLAPVLRKAMASKQVSGEHYRGRWVDVGTPQRLAELDDELSI